MHIDGIHKPVFIYIPSNSFCMMLSTFNLSVSDAIYTTFSLLYIVEYKEKHKRSK